MASATQGDNLQLQVIQGMQPVATPFVLSYVKESSEQRRVIIQMLETYFPSQKS